jgi:hypothetical protein
MFCAANQRDNVFSFNLDGDLRVLFWEAYGDNTLIKGKGQLIRELHSEWTAHNPVLIKQIEPAATSYVYAEYRLLSHY